EPAVMVGVGLAEILPQAGLELLARDGAVAVHIVIGDQHPPRMPLLGARRLDRRPARLGRAGTRRHKQRCRKHDQQSPPHRDTRTLTGELVKPKARPGYWPG